MTTTTSSTSTAVAEPAFSPQERLALAGFLAGYTGLTREAYALDPRQYASWCQLRHLRLFQARRADIECFARDLETRGRARATITRRPAPSPASTGTPSKKNSSNIHRPPISTGPAWIMSRMPPGWTATSSAQSWLPPGSARPQSTLSSPCSP